MHIMNVSNVTRAVPNTQLRYVVYQSYPLNVSRLGLVTHRPAKSRDRCDRRSREIFIFWGNLGKFFIFPSGNCHISPLKSSPRGKFLMFLVGKLLSNKQTYKIWLFMWLLQVFCEMCIFNLCPFWGNFNPRNTGCGKFCTFCMSAIGFTWPCMNVY